MKSMSHTARQGGFSLIELMVGLALLTLLAVAISGAFDGSRSRAQSLVAMMSELGSAQARLKNDTGCYVTQPDALYSRDVGTTVANECGRTTPDTWNGPYVTRFTVSATEGAGQVAADKISSGTLISFKKVPATVSGLAVKRYTIIAKHVPGDVAAQFLQECNGKADPAASFNAGQKCEGTGITTDDATVTMLYDETR